MIFGRRRFADVVERQLALFLEEDGDLLEEVDARLAAYDAAPREDAEEAYGDYLLAVEAAVDRLAEIRDSYAATLDPDAAEEYEQLFQREARRRFRQLAV